MDFLIYLFWPNPGVSTYSETTVVAMLLFCVTLLVGAFLLKLWRYRLQNAVTKKLTRTWSSAFFWFAFVGLLLIVSRVEGIQFLGMRFWSVLWGLLLALYIFLQLRQFRARHYQILPTMKREDPREKYLPKKK